MKVYLDNTFILSTILLDPESTLSAIDVYFETNTAK